MRRTVITGLGTISAIGKDKDEFWQALVRGESAIRPLSVENVNISTGACIADFEPEAFFASDDAAILDRHSAYAVIAAREAIKDAGLHISDIDISTAAVVLGTGCGGKHTDEVTYDVLYKQDRKRAHPLTIPKGMPSASASMVSKHLQTNGPAFVVSSACASGAHAIAQGMSMIASGMADVVITGATDAPFTYGLLKAWEALKITSGDTCRPFSKNRSGLVLGEGAGILVLESEAHARKRGARIYAELSGAGMTSDAGHITRPDKSGITAAMENALAMAGLETADIDYINAHGTGTQLNDSTETSAIRDVFKQHADDLVVSSTKSMHGHAMGASSALELIASVMALYHGIVPPTANYQEKDDACDLDYAPNTSRQCNIRAAMSNSFAFGGLNAVLVVNQQAGK